MASPPRLATSPVSSCATLPALANSKKRSSLQFTHAGISGNKRHKGATSITSGTSSAHPLRQTSFPPEQSLADGDHSPSVSSGLTGLAPSVKDQGKTKKYRGKGRKNREVGGPSARSPKARREVIAEGRGRSESHVQDLDDEDEDEDEVAQLQAAADADDGTTMNDTIAEKQKLSVLTAAFNQEQEERYSMFRRCKLKPEKVRKITNAVVSQSVPQAVVTAVNGIGKMFVGRLVEEARQVRAEWAAVKSMPRSSQMTNGGVEIDPTDFGRENSGNRTVIVDTSERNLLQQAKDNEQGPLHPDHFREALRRFKRNREMGGSGLGGVSVGVGLPGAAVAKTCGRRLLR